MVRMALKRAVGKKRLMMQDKLMAIKAHQSQRKRMIKPCPR
jgi:hypothetical protein